MTRYWEVVLRYGHVGTRRAIEEKRYLATSETFHACDVWTLAAEMPAVKCRGVLSVKSIDEGQFLAGRARQGERFYLQRLLARKVI